MIALQIDLALPEPAYEQIVRGLRGLLVEGKLDPGSQLPTVRQLAVDLGLNHNTVAEAYRMLAREGWLDLRQGRGATVVERARPEAPTESRSQLASRMRDLATKAIADGIARATIAKELETLAAALRKGESS